MCDIILNVQKRKKRFKVWARYWIKHLQRKMYLYIRLWSAQGCLSPFQVYILNRVFCVYSRCIILLWLLAYSRGSTDTVTSSEVLIPCFTRWFIFITTSTHRLYRHCCFLSRCRWLLLYAGIRTNGKNQPCYVNCRGSRGGLSRSDIFPCLR